MPARSMSGRWRPVVWLAAAVLSLLAETARADITEDTAKYCADGAANIVFYLDVTTPFDAIDQASLIDGVEKIYAGLGDGDRLSIRTIEDAFPRSRRLFDACMPWCESGGFIDDLFSDCTEGVVIDDRRHLQMEVVRVIRELAENSVELPHSEIVRTIAMSSGEEYRVGQANRLVIFSDMIENSEYLPSSRFLSRKNSDLLSDLAKDRLVPDLHEAEAVVFGIGRKGDPDSRDVLEQEKIEKIADFWDGFFALAGATVRMQPNLGRARPVGLFRSRPRREVELDRVGIAGDGGKRRSTSGSWPGMM